MAIQLNNLIAEALKVRKQAQSNATTLNTLNKPIPSTTGFKDSYRRNGQFSDSARYQFGSNYFLLPLVLDIYQITRKTFLTDQFEVLHRVYETHRADITKLEGLNNQKTRQEQAIARDNKRRQSEQKNPQPAGEQEAVNNNIVNATTGITSSPDGFFTGSSQQVANLASLDLTSAGNDQPSHPVLKQA